MPIPKYPNVIVKLVGEDGNSFAVMGKVTRALNQAHVPCEEVKEFVSEATGGDYNHLLQTCIKWVEVV